MADLAKCPGARRDESCPRRSLCYRFTAPDHPAGMQAWIEPSAVGAHCQKYVTNDEAQRLAEDDGA